MASFAIREITQEEIPAVADLVLRAFNQVSVEYGFQPDPDVTRLLARLEDDFRQGVKMVAAFSDGAPVGFLEIDEKDEEVFEVRQLAVDPEHQRQGFGQALLNRAEVMIRGVGGVAEVCAIIEGKRWLKDWLGRNGFFEEVSGRPEGVPCQVTILQKDLPPTGDSCSSCSDSGCGPSCGGCH